MKLLLNRLSPRRLADSFRREPDRWLARLVFLLGPWVCLWIVEILNENDVFSDLYAWQVLMNMIWYYILFIVCRLVLGRLRREGLLSCRGRRFTLHIPGGQSGEGALQSGEKHLK